MSSSRFVYQPSESNLLAFPGSEQSLIGALWIWVEAAGNESSYIPIVRGFLYLVAVMDWRSRKVLAWRSSNSMDAGFCVEALKEALEKYGPPEIFNSHQGPQFTSPDFTGVLQDVK